MTSNKKHFNVSEKISPNVMQIVREAIRLCSPLARPATAGVQQFACNYPECPESTPPRSWNRDMITAHIQDGGEGRMSR